MHFTQLEYKNGNPYISRHRDGEAWKNWAHECRVVNKYLENNGYLLCVYTAKCNNNIITFELQPIKEQN